MYGEQNMDTNNIMSDLEAENVFLKDRISLLEDEVKALNHSIHVYQLEDQTKQDRLTELSTQVDEQEDKISEQEDKISELEDKLDEYVDDLDDSEVAIEELLAPSSKRPPPHFKLPADRDSKTHSFCVGPTRLGKGYLITGFYPGTHDVGEIFIKMAKPSDRDYMSVSGDTTETIIKLQEDISDLHAFVAGILDQLAIAVSIGMQRGIPLEIYALKFKAVRFPPCGMTSNHEIPFASSILDYIFRYLGLHYIGSDEWVVKRR
jgi:ribonucleoside-diphosphate reductase alpha chain